MSRPPADHLDPAVREVLAEVVAVIPLKAIGDAKTRMAPSLSPEDRALLLRRSFDRVVAACAEAGIGRVLVVVGDDRGRGWALAAGVEALAEPDGGGLNAALGAADTRLGDRPSLVVPADLPLVVGEDLRAVIDAAAEAGADVAAGPRVVIAPTADGGTGALLRAPGGVIRPAYGRGSARRHAQAAVDAGVPVTWVERPGLSLDLDHPDDIARAGGWDAVTAVDPGPTAASRPSQAGGYPAA